MTTLLTTTFCKDVKFRCHMVLWRHYDDITSLWRHQNHEKGAYFSSCCKKAPCYVFTPLVVMSSCLHFSTYLSYWPLLYPKDNTQPIYTENNRGVVYAELSVLFAKVKFKVFVFHWYNIREGIFFGYFLSLVDQMCKG